MLPTHRRVATYRGREIYQRQPGFEYTPVLLGKIASFVVTWAGGDAVCAFMYSLLDALGGAPPDEAILLAAAVQAIEARIDAGALAPRTDETYEYRDGTFVEVRDPRWWISVYR
jgi:hypothetical protein